MSFKNFFDMKVYKECRSFRNEISKIAKDKFPKEEKYLLKSQLLRASRSITANISEGHGRFYFKENIQFCRIARGSLCECLEHLICAFDEKYIDEYTLSERKKHFDECLKLLNGYIKYLQKRKKEF